MTWQTAVTIISEHMRKAFQGWSAVRPHFLARAVAGGTLGSFAVMRRGLDISFLLALADSLQVATCDDSQDNASIPLPI